MSGLGGSEATRRAGYSKRNAGTLAYQLLQKAPIKKALAEGRERMAYAAGVSQDQAPSTGKHKGYNIPAPRHGLDGDDGFIKRTQVAIRRPVFYGDTTYVTGTVEKSSKMCMWATMRLMEC